MFMCHNSIMRRTVYGPTQAVEYPHNILHSTVQTE